MAISKAEAVWEGDLKGGKGHVKTGSGGLDSDYSFRTRFEGVKGTNPEELIGAAHAACFSMALSAGMGKAGVTPKRIHTTADVSLDKVGEGFKITKIILRCQAEVPGLDAAKFQEFANGAKTGCPISQALAATPIELDAKLV